MQTSTQSMPHTSHFSSRDRLIRILKDISPRFLKTAFRKVKPATMQGAFSTIYREDLWEGGSGIGSTVTNTAPYRKCVEEFIRANGIQSVVDLGCGDWQSTHLIDWNGASYLGLDVVPSVIEANRRKWGPRGFQFRLVDISKDELPSADLLLIKDVLQHWPNRNVLDFLPKLDNFKYAIVCNGIKGGPDRPMNSDIALTGFRPIDLRLPPFNLPAEELLRFRTEEIDTPDSPGKLVLLYRRGT